MGYPGVFTELRVVFAKRKELGSLVEPKRPLPPREARVLR
jgi:hypothetical protein